jgi:hypothetical protein
MHLGLTTPPSPNPDKLSTVLLEIRCLAKDALDPTIMLIKQSQ